MISRSTSTNGITKGTRQYCLSNSTSSSIPGASQDLRTIYRLKTNPIFQLDNRPKTRSSTKNPILFFSFHSHFCNEMYNSMQFEDPDKTWLKMHSWVENWLIIIKIIIVIMIIIQQIVYLEINGLEQRKCAFPAENSRVWKMQWKRTTASRTRKHVRFYRWTDTQEHRMTNIYSITFSEINVN